MNTNDSFLFERMGWRGPHVGDIRSLDFFPESNNYQVVVNAAGDVRKSSSPMDASNLVFANSALPALVASHFVDRESRILHIGTFSHKSDVRPYDPQTLYAATKFSGERYLEFFSNSSSLSSTILHTYDIYGPRQPHNRLIPYIVNKLMTGQNLHLTRGEQEIAPIHIQDVAKTILSLALEEERPTPGSFLEFDLYGPNVVKVKDVPQLATKALGLKNTKSRVHFDVPYSGREIFNFSPCHKLPPVPFDFTTLDFGIRTLSE